MVLPITILTIKIRSQIHLTSVTLLMRCSASTMPTPVSASRPPDYNSFMPSPIFLFPCPRHLVVSCKHATSNFPSVLSQPPHFYPRCCLRSKLQPVIYQASQVVNLSSRFGFFGVSMLSFCRRPAPSTPAPHFGVYGPQFV